MSQATEVGSAVPLPSVTAYLVPARVPLKRHLAGMTPVVCAGALDGLPEIGVTRARQALTAHDSNRPQRCKMYFRTLWAPTSAA